MRIENELNKVVGFLYAKMPNEELVVTLDQGGRHHILPQRKVTYTVWKFQDFSVIQILREIKFGESRSSKTAILANFGALNFVGLVKFSLQKVQKFMKYKIQRLQAC